MKKFILPTLIAFLLILPGCITIFEKYTINRDGSGSMEYLIDMSELYEMMAAFSDSAEEAEPVDYMTDIVPEFNAIPGITNVALTGDPEKYLSGIRFDFKDVETLNKALSILFKSSESPGETGKYVEIKRKTFTRYSLTSEEFNKDAFQGSEEIDEETMEKVLESMKYNIEVHFEKPVRKISTKAPYTVEGNTVTIETTLADIFNREDFLKTIIKTK